MAAEYDRTVFGERRKRSLIVELKATCELLDERLAHIVCEQKRGNLIRLKTDIESVLEDLKE